MIDHVTVNNINNDDHMQNVVSTGAYKNKIHDIQF